MLYPVNNKVNFANKPFYAFTSVLNLLCQYLCQWFLEQPNTLIHESLKQSHHSKYTSFIKFSAPCHSHWSNMFKIKEMHRNIFGEESSGEGALPVSQNHRISPLGGTTAGQVAQPLCSSRVVLEHMALYPDSSRIYQKISSSNWQQQTNSSNWQN